MKLMFRNNSSDEWQEIMTVTTAEIESTEPDGVYPRINDMSKEVTFTVEPYRIGLLTGMLKRSHYNNWRRRHGIPMIRYKEILRAGWGKKWRKYK